MSSYCIEVYLREDQAWYAQEEVGIQVGQYENRVDEDHGAIRYQVEYTTATPFVGNLIPLEDGQHESWLDVGEE